MKAQLQITFLFILSGGLSLAAPVSLGNVDSLMDRVQKRVGITQNLN